MKGKRNTLPLIAALVWSAAGFNILRIGLLAYPPHRTIINYLLSAVVFTVFQIFIFGRLVKKHTARICAYEEELHLTALFCAQHGSIAVKQRSTRAKRRFLLRFWHRYPLIHHPPAWYDIVE